MPKIEFYHLGDHEGNPLYYCLTDESCYTLKSKEYYKNFFRFPDHLQDKVKAQHLIAIKQIKKFIDRGEACARL